MTHLASPKQSSRALKNKKNLNNFLIIDFKRVNFESIEITCTSGTRSLIQLRRS